MKKKPKPKRKKLVEKIKSAHRVFALRKAGDLPNVIVSGPFRTIKDTLVAVAAGGGRKRDITYISITREEAVRLAAALLELNDDGKTVYRVCAV